MKRRYLEKRRTVWVKKEVMSYDYVSALILLVIAVAWAVSFIIFNYILASIVPIFFAIYTFLFLVKNAFKVEIDVPEDYVELSEGYFWGEEIKIKEEKDKYEKKLAFWTD
jgi:hypothetical protein